MVHCQRSFGGVTAGQSWSAYVDRDCNRVEKSNVQYSKRNLALGGPHGGQGWVVGSAGYDTLKNMCALPFHVRGKLRASADASQIIRRCLVGSRPLPTPLSVGERVFKRTIQNF